MKRIKCLLLTIVFLGTTEVFAQNDSVMRITNQLLRENNSLVQQIEQDLSLKQRYKLYPTENIYTFLQLDTETGRVFQVQWSLEWENEGTLNINDKDLSYGIGYGPGSFELYPTKNMYQFLLLDKTSGRMWHVQWGMEPAKRWIRLIY